MFRPLLAAALVCASSVSVFAADLPSRKAPASLLSPTPAWTWTGVYAGLNVGSAWGSGSSDFYTLGGAFLASDSGGTNGGEFRFGGQIGYRYQMPSNMVLGLQGMLEAAPDISASAAGLSLKRTGRAHLDLDGQLGYAFGDLLPYALAGVSIGKSDASLTAFGVTDNISTTRLGLLLGAGLDYHIWDRWVISAQYKVDWSNRYRYTFPNNGFYIERQERAQGVFLGVNYKF